MSLGNTGKIYRPRRPLWVVMADTDEQGGVGIIASRDIADIEVEIREDPWVGGMHDWNINGNRMIHYSPMRPRVTIDMRGLEHIRGPHLRAVLEALYARWAPTPEGDVNG